MYSALQASVRLVVIRAVGRGSSPQSLHLRGFGLWCLQEEAVIGMRGPAVRLVGEGGFGGVLVEVAVAGLWVMENSKIGRTNHGKSKVIFRCRYRQSSLSRLVC